MKKQTPSGKIAWPAWYLPGIRVAVRAPHFDRNFQRIYQSPTHCVHLYEYPCEMRMGRRRLAIREGDLTFTPAGTGISYHLEEPGHHLCIHFRAETAGSARKNGTIPLPLHQRLGPARDFAVQRLMAVIRWHAMGRHEPVARAAASVAFQEFLLWLGQRNRFAPRQTPRRADRAVDQVSEIIEKNIAAVHVIPELAEKVGMSQNYLAQCFRRRFGETIPRFILTRRIELARHLLATTDLPVGQIARSVGLPDAQHFNKQFRRLTGLSPANARMPAFP